MTETAQKTDKMKQVLDSLFSMAQKSQAGKKSGKVGVIIAFVISFIAIGFFYFEAWRKGAEHARLQHEHDVAAQKATMARIDAEIADTKAQELRAVREAATHEQNMADLGRRLNEVELQHAEALNKISQIKSWDDVDSYLGK